MLMELHLQIAEIGGDRMQPLRQQPRDGVRQLRVRLQEAGGIIDDIGAAGGEHLHRRGVRDVEQR